MHIHPFNFVIYTSYYKVTAVAPCYTYITLLFLEGLFEILEGYTAHKWYDAPDDHQGICNGFIGTFVWSATVVDNKTKLQK